MLTAHCRPDIRQAPAASRLGVAGAHVQRTVNRSSSMSSTHAPAALTSPVIVTGAASGIGLACAELLAEAGRPVALWDLQVDKAIVEAVRISEATGVAT
ncbi:SDR family NAD(P)-dependent oxidoreductase, partial [Bowmanella sp. Y57]